MTDTYPPKTKSLGLIAGLGENNWVFISPLSPVHQAGYLSRKHGSGEGGVDVFAISCGLTSGGRCDSFSFRLGINDLRLGINNFLERLSKCPIFFRQLETPKASNPVALKIGHQRLSRLRF